VAARAALAGCARGAGAGHEVGGAGAGARAAHGAGARAGAASGGAGAAARAVRAGRGAGTIEWAARVSGGAQAQVELRAKGARGSGMRRSGAARPGRARVRQQEEEEEELRGRAGAARQEEMQGAEGRGLLCSSGEPGRRSCEAKATARRDELGGATVQPGTASSLHPCGGRGRSNAAWVRRVAQDRRWW
jgi:hypothetical protein